MTTGKQPRSVRRDALAEAISEHGLIGRAAALRNWLIAARKKVGVAV